jgi:hypothetical protein
MSHKKILIALTKVLGGDVLPFKKPEKPEKSDNKPSKEGTKKSSLILDWKDADIYPVGGSKVKLLGVSLKGVGPGKRFMLSLVPKASGASKEILFQLDEVGGEFRRSLDTIPFDEAEKYIKEKLVKDIENAYSKIANIKVIQKIPADLSSKLDGIEC